MLKNTQLVALFTIFSQLVAFLRLSIIASRFGIQAEVDIYNLAIIVPTLITSVVIGWLQVSFVGSYLKIQKNESERTGSYLWSMTLMVLIVTLLTSLGSVLFRDTIAVWLVSSHRTTDLNLLADSLKFVVWLTLPMIFCEFLGLVLNCHQRFGISSIAPIINAIVSAAALYFIPENDLRALILTLALGWTVQIVVMFWASVKYFFPFQFEFFYAQEQIKYSLALALPLLPAVIFSNITSGVMQGYLSRMGEGTVAVFGYASRFQGAVTQIFVMGLGTVLLPHLASLFAEKKHQEIGLLFVKLCKVTIFLYLVFMLGVYLYGENLIYLLLSRGRFDQSVVKDVWWNLVLISISILPFSISTLMAKSFQALQKPGLLSISSIISLIITTSTCYLALKTQSYTGLLLSFAFAQIGVLIFFIYNFKRYVSQINFMTILVKSVTYSFIILLLPFGVFVIFNSFFEKSHFIWSVSLLGFCITLLVVTYFSKFTKWVSAS